MKTEITARRNIRRGDLFHVVPCWRSIAPVVMLAPLALMLVPSPAHAGTEKVLVTLFAARGSIKSLTLEAPFRIERANVEQSSGEKFLLTCCGGVLHVSRKQGAVSGQSALQRRQHGAKIGMPVGRRAVIQALAGRPLTVQLEDGTVRRYRGTLIVSGSGEELTVKNSVGLRDYAISVIGSESLPKMPEEALKAQSVLVQTLLLRYKPGDSLMDTTQTQAYSGADYERPEARRAFDATCGVKLLCDGSPVQVFFHSTCAGGTSSSAIFCNKKPSRRCDKGVACAFCKDSPFWHPTTSLIPAARFAKVSPAGIPVIAQRDEAGRPLILKYPDGKQGTAYQFWLKTGQALGWDKVPGTRFSIAIKKADVELTSTGAGHGAGLCQWGAVGMATAGRSYKEILSHYFPGSELVSK